MCALCAELPSSISTMPHTHSLTSPLYSWFLNWMVYQNTWRACEFDFYSIAYTKTEPRAPPLRPPCDPLYIRTVYIWYNMSNKSCPIFIVYSQDKNGKDFLDIQCKLSFIMAICHNHIFDIPLNSGLPIRVDHKSDPDPTREIR